MMVTNIVSNPTATITLEAGEWTPITSVPNKNHTEYFVSVYLHVSGGSINVSFNGHETISSDRRVSYQMTTSTDGPMGVRYRVVSGNPTVTATDMIICTLDEYRANKALLDSIEYFDGDSMPLA